MVQEYLVTFKSTTAALRAKQVLDRGSEMAEYSTTRQTAEVVPVPFKLSQTCYGMGVKCMATERGIRRFYKVLQAKKVDVKRLWFHDTNDCYIPVEQSSERSSLGE